MPAFLSSFPVSLLQPGRACALCLCWECCRHLCARAGRTSPAAAQCSRSPCTALPGSEVTNTEMRLEDTVVALSGLLCSESQEKTKRNLPYPSQALTHGSLQGVHAPQVPCSLRPGFVPYKGWPVSTLTPQANSCTRPSAGKHRPPGAAPTLLSWDCCPGVRGRGGLLLQNRTFHFPFCTFGLFR